jgi:hypothetical protein
VIVACGEEGRRNITPVSSASFERDGIIVGLKPKDLVEKDSETFRLKNLGFDTVGFRGTAAGGFDLEEEEDDNDDDDDDEGDGGRGQGCTGFPGAAGGFDKFVEEEDDDDERGGARGVGCRIPEEERRGWHLRTRLQQNSSSSSSSSSI